MKKSLTLIAFIIVSFASAQDFSYGIIIGNSNYGIGNNNGSNTFETNGKSSIVIFGGYGEYNFTKKIGVKTEVLINKNEIVYFPTKQPFEINVISISPSFKYDFGTIYREGFYVLIGPKCSILTSVKSDDENAEGFSSFNIGAQLGLGWRVFKYVDLQSKFEYDLSPFYKFDNGNNSRFFGVVLSANIDIAKIVSGK